MKKIVCAVIVLLALGIGGCAALDWFYGVNPDGTTKSGEHASPKPPASVAAPIVDLFLPGAGALLGAVGTLWAAVRGRMWKKAAITTFDVIEAGANAGKGVMALKRDLAQAHKEAGIYGLVNKVVSKYKNPEPPLPTLPQ